MLTTLCVQKSKIEAIPMSRKTTVCRIEAIGVNVQESLLNTAYTFKCFLIALDESTDILDTTQLLIFITGIDEYFLFWHDRRIVVHGESQRHYYRPRY